MRKSIPKTVKDHVWDVYIGVSNGIGKCFVCGRTEIRQSCFDAGHVISVRDGGENTIDNLRPVCPTCNKSMGSQHLYDFMRENFPDMYSEIPRTRSPKFSIDDVVYTRIDRAIISYIIDAIVVGVPGEYEYSLKHCLFDSTGQTIIEPEENLYASIDECVKDTFEPLPWGPARTWESAAIACASPGPWIKS
jgi:hypothetical protein